MFFCPFPVTISFKKKQQKKNKLSDPLLSTCFSESFQLKHPSLSLPLGDLMPLDNAQQQQTVLIIVS